jgi:hypothetical protein
MSELGVLGILLRVINKPMPSPLDESQFSRWLTGFIDAEGNFQVFLDRNYLRLAFRIRLHIDDVEILYAIKAFLGVGRVTLDRGNANCVFIISNVRDLVNVLFPLIDNYKLFTTKWLDYLSFKSAANYLLTAPTTLLDPLKLAWANNLMANMNAGRSSYDYSLIPPIVIDPYWLLGFIEGEGTFGLKNLVPYFQLGQHSRNSMVLEAISDYLKSLPQSFPFTLISPAPAISTTIHKGTLVSVISMSSIDALYDYIMFFLLAMPFQTRKGIDFSYWCVVLHFHKFGYFYLTQGRIVTAMIAKFINSGRYSNNKDGVSQEPLAEDINNVLASDLPVKITPQMRHLHLAQAFAKVLKPKGIWVYKDGVMFGTSPYSTYNDAMRAIGYSHTSSAARRTIDTGKVVGNGFTFYSSPQPPFVVT